MTTISNVRPIAPTSPSPGVASATPVAEDTSLLPGCQQLRASGDIGAMIAALLLEAAHDQREIAHRAKEAAVKSEEALEDAKLDHMRTQADASFHGGLAEGIGSGVGGVAEMGSGLGGTAAPICGGAAKLEEGGGKGVSAFFKRAADDAGVDAARDGFAAEQATHRVDSAIDADKDARDLASKALDLYKEYLSGKNDAQKAAILRA